MPHEKSYRCWIIAGLLILGLYYPTDASAKFTILSLSAHFICLVLLSALVIGGVKRPSAPACIVLLSMVPLLFVFTGTSGLVNFRMGAFVSYGLLSVLYLTDIRSVTLPRWFQNLWLAVNVINIMGGIAVLLGVRVISDFIVDHYSFAFDGLVSRMMMFHKPVGTFATHSLAAFFWYLFFWLNLQGFKATRKRVLLILSVCNLALTVLLLSVTGLVLFGVGAVQLLSFVWASTQQKVVVSVALCTVLMAFIFWGPKVHWKEYADTARDVLENPGSGFLGRFLPGGTMYPNLEYMRDHPFSPVGLSYKEGLLVGDSGMVEYLVRGSVPFFLLVYGGLFYFMKRNLISNRHFYFLFIALLGIEVGMTTLTYFRTLYLLPVFIAYLNNMRRSTPEISGKQPMISYLGTA